jgi:hypothetical protein
MSHRTCAPTLPDWHDLSRVVLNGEGGLAKLSLLTPNSGERLSKIGVDALRVPKRTIEYGFHDGLEIACAIRTLPPRETRKMRSRLPEIAPYQQLGHAPDGLERVRSKVCRQGAGRIVGTACNAHEGTAQGSLSHTRSEVDR